MLTPTPGRHAVLYPAVAEAARRLGTDAVGLVDVGNPAGLNLQVDRVGIAYDDGRTLGDPSSPVQVTCSMRGDRPVPATPLPAVVCRVLVDAAPIDVTDPGDTMAPGDLEAEIALAASAPPRLVRGKPEQVLLDAVALVPDDAVPVVITTWSLSRLSGARRVRFVTRLEEAAATRPVAWVSVEGVGVPPGVPTLGDRPASGHSLLGVAVPDGRGGLHAETVGRCWLRGRYLAWLADDPGLG